MFLLIAKKMGCTPYYRNVVPYLWVTLPTRHLCMLLTVYASVTFTPDYRPKYSLYVESFLTASNGIGSPSPASSFQV